MRGVKHLMDKEFQDFEQFVESQTNPDGSVPAYVAEWADGFITEVNVEEIIKLLAKLPGQANHVFWERINTAPTTDAGWKKMVFLGSNISGSEEEQNEMRKKAKRVVNLVRATKYYQKTVNELFRNRNA